MGLEEWYYSPPLPPAHEIRLAPEELEYARTLALSVEGREALIHGVEVYIGGEDGRFSRGMFAAREKGFGGLVSRIRTGGTTLHAGSGASLIIPAEFVDAGLLGERNVPDLDKPIPCKYCTAEIPGRSTTGRCDDRDACKERRAAMEDARSREEWRKFVGNIDEHVGWLRDDHKQLIEWAAGKIERIDG
jgi:hypothetical protein